MAGKQTELLTVCYRLLDSVYREGAFSSLKAKTELKSLSEKYRSEAASIFYGVLRYDVQLSYCIGKVANKPPKPAIRTLLKLGIYLRCFGGMPDYATRSEILTLCDTLGKSGVKGFVSAALTAAAAVELPEALAGAAEYVSVRYSLPLWLAETLLRDYGIAFIDKYFSAMRDTRPHIRYNGLKTTAALFNNMQGFTPSAGGGYASSAVLSAMNQSLFTVQSLSSVLVTRFYAETLQKGARVLDVCAAPGGKSVYLYELTNAEITACDIHPHRVRLIENYAARMGAQLETRVCDASLFQPAFENAYDSVLCDVPCSGIGVIEHKPDILLHRKEEDIAALSALQLKILNNAARYVAPGGSLNYSTCTILKEENENVIEAFLREHSEFSVYRSASTDEDGYMRLYPHTHGCDGFFAVKLIKKESSCKKS